MTPWKNGNLRHANSVLPPGACFDGDDCCDEGDAAATAGDEAAEAVGVFCRGRGSGGGAAGSGDEIAEFDGWRSVLGTRSKTWAVLLLLLPWVGIVATGGGGGGAGDEATDEPSERCSTLSSRSRLCVLCVRVGIFATDGGGGGGGDWAADIPLADNDANRGRLSGVLAADFAVT